MTYKALCRALCMFTALVLVLASGCGRTGNIDDNIIQQVHSDSEKVTSIERDFVGVNVSTPEYIGGVTLLSENGNRGINLKNFDGASVYCYTLDRDFFSIEKPLKSEDVIKRYINDLEKTFGVKFNVSNDFDNEVYFSNLTTDSGVVGLAICNGDFDDDFGSDLSVAVKSPNGSSGSASNSGDKNTGGDTDDIMGQWNSVYYLDETGKTAKTEQYKIFVNNTGTASLYIDSERYAGTWKVKDKGYEFAFSGLNGYGEMGKINNSDCLIVQFDTVEGKIAFKK